ncbi:shikimate kinase [Halioglobus japonicus]|uniref:Shikimate kinase n=1 Tax=Halioglobus japonicus TaxID=930805 RepID=A0AAP8MDH3_9GAMM|nr:AAA family ATPase [Halioglobus japonicus]AQA17850.1 shikimate kinase [Halioglobus japonicus]PLW85811.1 shikimate kinase [Halioglobus japonicus]
MQRILIFGNSGSGKSTLASRLSKDHGLAHLDLDTLAWLPTMPPERMPLAASQDKIVDFIGANPGWVIEGCYSDLLEMAVPEASEMIYMNLPVNDCVENARSRPWEPHKYPSKEAQDENLDMLIEWISQYSDRTDTFSAAAHKALYEEFTGTKRVVTSNGDTL